MNCVLDFPRRSFCAFHMHLHPASPTCKWQQPSPSPLTSLPTHFTAVPTTNLLQASTKQLLHIAKTDTHCDCLAMAPPELWRDYFDSPTFSDLTIRLNDRLVHVHRIVLCRGSPYFEKLLAGSFKVRHSSLHFCILADTAPRRAKPKRSNCMTMIPWL